MTNQRLVRVSNKAVSSASVRIIGRGPYGEKIVSCENLYLTEEEIKKVRSGNYKGVLLFQFSGKRWMRLIDQAVRTVFEKLNIQLLEMFDADSNNQVFIEKVWEWMEKNRILYYVLRQMISQQKGCTMKLPEVESGYFLSEGFLRE